MNRTVQQEAIPSLSRERSSEQQTVLRGGTHRGKKQPTMCWSGRLPMCPTCMTIDAYFV